MTTTRSEAIQQGLKYYFTGVSCPNGHIDKRKVHNSTCYSCAQQARDRCNRIKAVKRTKPKRKVAISHPEYQRERSSRIRHQLIQYMGGKCVTCGYSDERALQIDHVNGGGVKELRSLTKGKYYKQVMNDQTGKYQLLCANCNWVKRVENQECRRLNSDS